MGVCLFRAALHRAVGGCCPRTAATLYCRAGSTGWYSWWGWWWWYGEQPATGAQPSQPCCGANSCRRQCSCWWFAEAPAGEARSSQNQRCACHSFCSPCCSKYGKAATGSAGTGADPPPAGTVPVGSGPHARGILITGGGAEGYVTSQASAQRGNGSGGSGRAAWAQGIGPCGVGICLCTGQPR